MSSTKARKTTGNNNGVDPAAKQVVRSRISNHCGYCDRRIPVEDAFCSTHCELSAEREDDETAWQAVMGWVGRS